MEDVDVGDVGGLVVCIGLRELRSEEIDAAGVAVGAIGMVALLVNVVGAERPVAGEGVLHAARDVNRVRGLVGGIDQVGATSG